MIEHNNRDIAKKHAEFITGKELRLYVANPEEKWLTPSKPVEREIVNIDEINNNLDNLVLSRLDNHLKVTLGLIREFHADIDYLGFINKVESLCQEYRLAYNFGVNTFRKY